ncbi:baseplate wedge protein [Citrobacter phage KKP_3664]|nr:baseplate wedge protein [Citrobacter phage KKP_3664]
MIKAPSITSLRVDKLAANFVYLKWDSVGMDFYYVVEMAETRGAGGAVIPDADLTWFQLGYAYANEWFSTAVQPDSFYKFRIMVTHQGFEPSDWVYSDELWTFTLNAYAYSTMREFTPSDAFINEKFAKNNQNYVNFNNDVIMAALMKEDFVFSPLFTDVSQISDKILTQENYHEIQDHIEHVCNDINRTFLVASNGLLYLFERFQNMAKVSNDKGQTWHYYKAFNDRVGNPVSRSIAYQSTNTTYVLGYDRIFYGRTSTDIRWSADDVRFSADDITFAKLGNQTGLDFDVDSYNTFAKLPGNVSKYAEAMACSDDWLYVVAKNIVRRIALKQTPIDTNPSSPTFGEKIFDTDSYTVVQGNDKIVVKKMDVMDGKLYVLVTGEVKVALQDPTKPENVVPSDDSGVYQWQEDTKTFVRLYGNTEEERFFIEHEYTNMSTNGKEIFISVANYKFPGTLPDPELLITNPELSAAVKYDLRPGYTASLSINFSTIRASIDDPTVWKFGAQEYYNEANYSWFFRDSVRTWITNDNRPLVVYPKIVYELVTDTAGPSSVLRVNKEVWDRGHVTIYINNIKFTGFTKYTNGVLLYKSSGEIIGFFELSYRARDSLTIFWKPDNTLLVADLIQQEREKPYVPDLSPGLIDPDLSHMITRFAPQSYLDQEYFEKFGEYYLQFVSLGENTYYNKLLNLIRNKYPREKNSVEYLWSEVNRRNIYLDKTKRDQVVRFFESRCSDFYSTKGIEASYKFLFKLLYNEDVTVEIESSNTLEYDILVSSTNISQDIVGRTIYTPTARANVTYIERDYKDGQLRWSMTLHNVIGNFLEGQVVKSEKTNFTGNILRGVRGKQMANNSIDYFNRGRSYYVMKIRSNLPASRYKDDVLRFVHPVGFGFIGITMLTVFINSGLSMTHSETIIDILRNYRFDSGYPKYWPDRVARLDGNGNQTFDLVTGEALYEPHPKAGQPFNVPPEYDTDEQPLNGVLPSARRFDHSPLFDSSAVKYSQFRNLVEKRLKDDAGNPRDPNPPTQRKVGK